MAPMPPIPPPPPPPPVPALPPPPPRRRRRARRRCRPHRCRCRRRRRTPRSHRLVIPRRAPAASDSDDDEARDSEEDHHPRAPHRRGFITRARHPGYNRWNVLHRHFPSLSSRCSANARRAAAHPRAARAHRPRRDCAHARVEVASARGLTSERNRLGARLRLQAGPDGAGTARARKPGSGGRPRGYWCAACQTRIADDEAALEFAGAHRHRFVNPAGVAFEIGCFREARCSAEGAPTLDATWFAGFAWTFAHCANCGEHLGWCYDDGAAGRFDGLILARLVGPL